MGGGRFVAGWSDFSGVARESRAGMTCDRLEKVVDETRVGFAESIGGTRDNRVIYYLVGKRISEKEEADFLKLFLRANLADEVARSHVLDGDVEDDVVRFPFGNGIVTALTIGSDLHFELGGEAGSQAASDAQVVFYDENLLQRVTRVGSSALRVSSHSAMRPVRPNLARD